MSTQWEAPNRTLAKRVTADFSRQSHRIPLRHRLDVVLFTGLLLSLIGLVALWYFGVKAADRFDLFEAPVIQPIADDRILVNVRDEIADRPLLDAFESAPRSWLLQQYSIEEFDPGSD